MVVERVSMERVCVTAGGGFIGSCLVKNLLERGYIVHATSTDPENPAKTSHLLSLEGAKERLHLFKANLYEKGSFDSAINGCDFVINLATSLDYTKDPEKYQLIFTILIKFFTYYLSLFIYQLGFIQPTIEGSLDILRVCKEAKTVRRVIHISSITAAIPLTENGEFKGKLDESCWTPIQYMRSKKPLYWGVHSL
ncbi:putative anthocyanidin reductase [Cryptomeria japonica]|uniref:putative anthocyanidin reductase n=1 Tax=Cryptomeria japonica TaxID=3369 RepID=UPI0027D9D5CF|nr:putative anthocyanidin reductase [Cryptomeria japonica]